MIKKFFNLYAKTFFFTSLPIIVLAVVIMRLRDIRLGYAYLTVGTLLMALFISFAITAFRSDRGKGYLNAILGYAILWPALLIFRFMFGQYLFRRVAVLYLLMVLVGIIYGIALWIASRKYREEVDELNRLLLDKEKNKDEDEDEEA